MVGPRYSKSPQEASSCISRECETPSPQKKDFLQLKFDECQNY